MLMKANSLQKDAQSLKIQWSFKDYLSKDYLAIAISASIVFLYAMIYPEIMTTSFMAKYTGFVKISFMVVGFIGSIILNAFLNKSKAYLRNEMSAQSTELNK